METTSNLGVSLRRKFDSYRKDRLDLEQKLLKNRRQFKGEYDPDIVIPVGRSRVYPKLTRVKVIGMVSRLMDLLFPRTEKNYTIAPTPFPDLSESDLNKLLESMPPGMEVNDEVIEKAIYALAEKRCARMDKVITDQMEDTGMDYITLARKVIFSAVLYGYGVLKGPLVEEIKKRTWVPNQLTGKFSAKTITALIPHYQFVPVWGFYPDLTAKARSQMDGAFERHVMNKLDLRAMADRSDFKGEAIKKFLSDFPKGNYKEQTFEQEISGEKNSTNQNINKGDGKYEAIEWWGNIAVDELKAAAVQIPDGSEDIDSLTANVWMLNDVVIKIALSPYPKEIKLHHIFVYEDDDTTELGTGMPEVIRESQMAVCAAARMLLDNSAFACGPMLEVNRELLAPGMSTVLHPYKVFEREGLGAEANIPAVREITVDAHISELKEVVDMFREFADTEALLPAALAGDMGGGASEPFRTAQNTSQLMGAAALPIRDVVRNFDQFTESVLTSLYVWNMTFNPDPEIKGDYRVKAVGSTSLIAKEVRSMALDNLMNTISDEDKEWLRDRRLLVERLAVRDLPADELLLTQEEYDENQQKKQQGMQQQQRLQEAQINADINATEAKGEASKASAVKALADASAVGAQVQNDALTTLINTVEVLSNGNGTGTDEGSAANNTGSQVSQRPSNAGGYGVNGNLP